LIYQLKYKEAVDIAYLENLIAQMLPNKEFFIQKAIGWSLRQLSKFHPDEVRRILTTYPIKGLAYREASKYL
jgi:3-methyladenine DNA glycosylase AlkD